MTFPQSQHAQPGFQGQHQQAPPVPFTGTFDVTDQGAVPDGTYELQLVRLETYVGTNFQSNEPQNKLRFVLTVLSGPYQGQEVWNVGNLPDRDPQGRLRIGKKSGVRKFCDMLRGRPLVDGERFDPNRLTGTRIMAVVANGNITSGVPQTPQQAAPMQQTPAVQQTHQPAAPSQDSIPFNQPAADNGQQQPQAPLLSGGEAPPQQTPYQPQQQMTE